MPHHVTRSREWSIPLDAYEIGNLKGLLQWARFANSGDWYGQILNKLEEAEQHLSPCQPNLDHDRLDEQLVYSIESGDHPGSLADLPWNVTKKT